MQPPTSANPGAPVRPLPIAQVTTAMTVVDSAGEGVGAVTAVEMPGTDVRPDSGTVNLTGPKDELRTA
jgi:hypothetical protein